MFTSLKKELAKPNMPASPQVIKTLDFIMPEKIVSAPTQSQKIHYRLTLDEWLQAANSLKPAELKVLYYLRTLDPFGDRKHRIGVRDTAALLKLNPGTVSRALKVLDAQGWISLDLVEVTVQIKTKPIPPAPPPEPPEGQPQTSKPSDSKPSSADAGHTPSEGVVSGQRVASRSAPLSDDHECCVQTTSVASRSALLCTDNTAPPEPSPSKVPRSPHTLKTLNTDQSLKIEREKHEISCPLELKPWLIKRAARLPDPPQFLDQWIESQAKNPFVLAQFWREQAESQRREVPRPVENVCMDDAQLYQLQADWRMSGDAGRSAIRELLMRNPTLNYEIGPNGPRKKAAA